MNILLYKQASICVLSVQQPGISKKERRPPPRMNKQWNLQVRNDVHTSSQKPTSTDKKKGKGDQLDTWLRRKMPYFLHWIDLSLLWGMQNYTDWTDYT